MPIAVVDQLGHQALRVVPIRLEACPQVPGDVSSRPSADAGVRVGRDIRRQLSLGALDGPGIREFDIQAPHHVARRVTFGTVPEGSSQVGAPVPFCLALRVGSVGTRFEVEPTPHSQQWTPAERRGQVRDGVLPFGMGQGEQVGLEIQQIPIAHPGERGEGKDGEEARTIGSDAMAHGPYEVGIPPRPDTRL